MILTLVETDLEGAATEVSLEALSFARDISAAGNGVPVDAVVFGDLSDDLRGELAAYGVRTIHHVGGDDVAAYSGAGWASAIQQVRDAAGSVVVMAAGTDRGTELMAHVATRSGAAMAANVLSFSGLAPFVVTRQVVGGSAMEEMNLHQRPAIFTVAGHAVEAKPADTEGAAEVVEHTPTIAPQDLVARVQSVAEVEADDESGAVPSAKDVVGAGRGVGGPDKFDDVTELADLLHGAIGVSRVVTSAGWRPHHEQVGQTGSRISPDLYIPCGISGAIQHWAGCSSAKTILAINSDAEAPMVTRATYAVIGDLHEILPAINEEIRKRGYGS
jgi:electron transfer flavoprotein alpha subunit